MAGKHNFSSTSLARFDKYRYWSKSPISIRFIGKMTDIDIYSDIFLLLVLNIL